MERQRVRAMVIAIGVLIALCAVIVFTLQSKDKVATKDAKDVQQGLPVVEQKTPEVSEVQKEDIPSTTVVAATTVVRAFVERLGSYSSESDYGNLEDVFVFSAPNLRASLEATLARERAKTSEGSGYSGVSTTFIRAKVLEQGESTQRLLVTTQRVFSFGSPKSQETRYQDIEVSLTRSGDTWLVESYTWKD